MKLLLRLLHLLLVLPPLGASLLVALRGRAIVTALRRGVAPGDVARALVPKHPIPMRTLFRRCFLVNFAVEPAAMSSLLPSGIEPDIYEGKAWLSIVVAEMDKMRPAFLPRMFGTTYNQIVYRAVVRCEGERGVYFLRSDADNLLMSLAGDWLTIFRFHYSPMAFRCSRQQMRLDLSTSPEQQADIHARYDMSQATRSLPPSSPFPTIGEAQKFLVELFVAFGYDPVAQKLLKVRIKRGEWDVRVVLDVQAEYTFMQNSAAFPPGVARLDSVFYVQELPYYWHTLERRR